MQDREYTQKLMRLKLKRMFSMVLGCVGVVVFVIFLNRYITTKAYDTIEIISEIAITKVSGADWVKLGESVLTYTKDGANCVSEKGVLRWNKAYQLQEPEVDVCGNIAVIGEYNGTSLYVVSEQKEIGEITTGMPIKDFCVSSTGIIGVVLDDGVTTWIYLYDQDGEELVNIKTTMQDSGYPIAIDISDNGILFMVSYVYIENVQVKSRVAFYNFGEVGQNKSDMLVSGFDYTETIVPVIQFIGGNSSFAVADNRLMVYEGKEIPLHVAEILLYDEIQSAVYSDSYIGLVHYNYDLDEKYKLMIYDDEALLVSGISFDMFYNEILMTNQRVMIYNENEICVYKMNGQLIYKEQIIGLIQKVLLTDKEDKFMIVYEDRIEVVELR